MSKNCVATTVACSPMVATAAFRSLSRRDFKAVALFATRTGGGTDVDGHGSSTQSHVSKIGEYFAITDAVDDTSSTRFARSLYFTTSASNYGTPLSYDVGMRILTCVFTLAIATAGCKKEAKPAEPAKDDKPAPTEPAPKSADPAPALPPPAAKVDQSDPTKVVEFVFAAAASGKPDGLSGLCDPAGGGDGDVKDICGVKAGDPKWEEFVTYFGKGKVSAAKIEGETAAVEIMFGPKGDKKETMNLKKLDGKWYLDGF